MKHRTALTVALCLAMTIAACAERSEPPPPPPPNPFIDTHWVMDSTDADAPTIEFTESRAGGHTGCNQWYAQTTSNDPALAFSGIGTTRRVCDPALMETERAFVAALRDTRTAHVENDLLVLRGATGAELARLERAR